MSRTIPFALAVAIALAAIPLALGHNDHSVWYDEALSHKVASEPDVPSLVHRAMELRGYPPLYFMAVRLGLEWRDDTIGLRIVSMVCGALAVVAVFLLARAVAGSGVGVIAALLLPLTPGFFRYFVDGNAYTLFALASCLSLLWLLRALRSDQRRDWALYGAATVVGLFTHTLFIFHVAGHLVAAVAWRAPWREWTGLGAAWRAQRRFVLTWLGAVAPWAAFVAFYAASSGRVDPPNLERLLSPLTLLLVPALYVGSLSASPLVQLLLWPVLQLLGLRVGWRKWRKELVFLLLAMAVPLLAITAFTRLFFIFFPYRFGLGIFPVSVVVAALAVAWVGRGRWAELAKWARAIGAVAVGGTVLYLATGVAWFATASPDAFTYQDWEGSRRVLAQQMRPDDALLLGGGELSETPFLYHYAGPVAPVVVGSDGELATTIVSLAAGPGGPPPRLWLVFASLAHENQVIRGLTSKRWPTLDERVTTLRGVLDEAGYQVDAVTELKRVVVVGTSRRQV